MKIRIYKCTLNPDNRIVETEEGRLYGFAHHVEYDAGLEEENWGRYIEYTEDTRGELVYASCQISLEEQLVTLQREFNIVDEAAAYWKEQAIALGYKE